MAGLTFAPRLAADAPPSALDGDLAYSARPFFRKLVPELQFVARLLGECRRMRDRSTAQDRRWGIPSLFFADEVSETDRRKQEALAPQFPSPYVELLSGEFPAEFAIWERLPERLDDARSLLMESLDVRRMARAVPGLTEVLTRVPQAGELHSILSTPEDEVWLAINPAARVGLRFTVEGAAVLDELHDLLIDHRPLTTRIGGDFRLFPAAALLPSGMLPLVFEGSSRWYWGLEKLAAVPSVHGERILILGDPVVPRTPAGERSRPLLTPRLRPVQSLGMGEVETWLRGRCPQYRPSLLPLRRAG